MTTTFSEFIAAAVSSSKVLSTDNITGSFRNKAIVGTTKVVTYSKVAYGYVVSGSIAVYDTAKRFLASKAGKVAIKATAATGALFAGATVTATAAGAAVVGYTVYGLGVVGLSILKGERKSPLQHTLAVGEGILYIAGITVGYLLLSPIIVEALVHAFVWAINGAVALVNTLIALWFNFGALIVG